MNAVAFINAKNNTIHFASENHRSISIALLTLSLI